MGDNIRKEVPYFPDFDIKEAIVLSKKDKTKGYMSITMQTYVRIKDDFGQWRLSLVVRSWESVNFDITDIKKSWDVKNGATKRFMKDVYCFQNFGVVNEGLYNTDGEEAFPVDPIQEEEKHRVGKEYLPMYELPELEKFIYWDCEDVADFIRDHGSSKKDSEGNETLFLHFPITVHKDGSITSKHRVID